jgi:5-methylthioadenosine/S-adenosylhomocysteine deaminase
MPTTLLTADQVLTLDPQDHHYQPGFVLIEDDRITGVGPLSEVAGLSYEVRTDLGPRLLMPGLVNAHTHSPMVLFRGLVEGHTLFSLDGWYNTIRVVEEVMQPDMLPAAVTVSCAEMIRTGTTCFADQYFWMDRIVPAVRESGLRAALAYGIVELGNPEARERELAAAGDFLEGLQGDPLLTAWLGPHAFFVDNRPEAMLRELELVQRYGTGFHIHLGTSGEEDRICREQYGCSAVEQLERMGILTERILAAHCLTVPEADLALLAKRPFTAVIAPSSAMRNAAGAAPLKAMLAAGVNLALGTDNVANNNSYDLFKEIQITGKLWSMLEKTPNAIPTRAIVEMATLGGARALGLEDRIGSLEPGKQADLIALDLEEIGWAPQSGQDVYTALVYSVTGMHVRDVMVAGRWLYRNGAWTTIDYAQARAQMEVDRDRLHDLLDSPQH